MNPTPIDGLQRERQVLYWRLLAGANGQLDQARNLDKINAQALDRLGMPKAVTDPNLSIDSLLQRYPELKPDFAGLQKLLTPPEEGAEAPEEGPVDDAALRRSQLYAKLLLNVLGSPCCQGGTVSAQQYNQWCQDVAKFEEVFGRRPGELRGKGGPSGQRGATAGTGMGPLVGEEQLREGLKAMEKDLIERMALREILQDDKMAAQLTPSMGLVEQLLHDKANLSGKALNNARSLIRQFIDQLAEVLRLQVLQAVRGKLDRSVPPKRVFRNLDLKRTLWKNLTNFDPDKRQLYVQQLYYRHTAKKSTPTRMIVVVDQSGSMVDAMVQCTILASIFAGLPRTDVHLFAFDTRTIDLTPYVHDPFEVLMRTNLGGGTLIHKALLEAAERIEEPRNTAVVLISDFFEGGSDQVLFDYIKGLKDSGVRFIPVGAVTSSGYFSVNQWFRTKLKEIGSPILTGHIKKLIQELKNLL